MHARRTLFDDKVSKEIILNDTDIAKATQSTYYMQIFDRNYEQSLLREYQMNQIDSPLEYFFNFDHWHNPFRIEENAQPLLFGALNASDLIAMGLPPTARIEVMPKNESFFYLRMENLHDKFEHHKQDNYFVNLSQLKAHIQLKIFGKSGKIPEGVSIVIQETTLTGN